MKEDIPIVICQVENGFTVSHMPERDYMVSSSSNYVFQSINELCAFIESHFTFRRSNPIKQDLLPPIIGA